MPLLPRLEDLTVESRRVFVRADLDAPLDLSGGLADDDRVRAAVSTLRHLQSAGARVIVGAHIGHPDGPVLALDPAAERLAELLECDVCIPDEVVGDGVSKLIADLRPGGLVILPNLFQEPGERDHDPKFAQALASTVDVYVNDALAASIGDYASITGIPRRVSEYAAGFRIHAELDALSPLEHPTSPFVGILGGGCWQRDSAMLAPWIERLGPGDHLVVGGETGLLLLAAQEGRPAGGMLGTHEERRVAQRILAKAAARDIDLVLPLDIVAATSAEDDTSGVFPAIQELPPHHRALDMGPQTVIRAAALIATARMVWWHGAVGAFEHEVFAAGTLQIARALADAPGKTWAHGRSALGALRRIHAQDRVDHRLTGDDASLAIIQGKPVIGISTITRKEEA